MPVTALNTVVLPAPFGPMSESMASGETLSFSAFTAVRPPKRIVRLSISRRLMRMKFGFDLPGRKQALGLEAHHQDQREAEEHVFPVAGRGEDILAADELVGLEKIGDVFQHDRVEAGHHQRAEQHAANAAHAAND